MQNNFLPLIILLVLVLCYLACDDKTLKSDKNSMFFVSLLIVGLVMFFVIKDVNDRNKDISETFTAPITYRLSKPMRSCPKGPKLSRVVFTTPDGEDIPLKEVMNSSDYPNTNGLDSPKSMFLLKHNLASPSNCPSTYTTSNGCIALTENQLKALQRR